MQKGPHMAAVSPGLSPSEKEAVGEFGKAWWVLLVLGILSAIIGLLAIFWPGQTIVVVAIIFAIWLAVSGIFQLVQAFSHGLDGGMRALLIISGVISIILGLFALRSAFQAVEILTIFIGLAFLFRGLMSLIIGLANGGQTGRGWNIFVGILLIIGGVVIFVWPGISLLTLCWVVGIWLVVLGLFEIVGAFQVRSAAKKLAA